MIRARSFGPSSEMCSGMALCCSCWMAWLTCWMALLSSTKERVAEVLLPSYLSARWSSSWCRRSRWPQFGSLIVVESTWIVPCISSWGPGS
jgi:hypothetical protein